MKIIFNFFRTNVKVNIDESQPTTTIHIRLENGSRITGRLNLSHTINDLHTFVMT